MSDSGRTEAERKTRQAFRIGELAALLFLVLAIGLFDRFLNFVPNREELGPRSVALHFKPAALNAEDFGPFRLAGAWDVRSDDERVGGISALALDRGELVGLSDNGMLVRFRPPQGLSGEARIQEVPDGPGDGRFKRNRDSEALARDTSGRGWWVAFENRHELWLYDERFGSALERIELGRDRWRANKGVEALATEDGALLLFPEEGRSILRLTGSKARTTRLDKAGRVSDVVAIARGRLIVVERRLTPFGFANSLLFVSKDGQGYRVMGRMPLPLRPIDNVEGIAVEHRPNGGRRIWLITDDNYQRPLRTLLIALDTPGVDPGKTP